MLHVKVGCSSQQVRWTTGPQLAQLFLLFMLKLSRSGHTPCPWGPDLVQIWRAGGRLVLEVNWACMLAAPCILVAAHKPVGWIVVVLEDSDGVPPPSLAANPPPPPDSGAPS